MQQIKMIRRMNYCAIFLISSKAGCMQAREEELQDLISYKDDEAEIVIDYTNIDYSKQEDKTKSKRLPPPLPRSILKLKSESEPSKIKKKVSWPDLKTGEPLTKTVFVPGPASVDRTSINSKYQRMKKERQKRNDRFFILCCGSILCIVLIFVSVLAFIMMHVFGAGYHGIDG